MFESRLGRSIDPNKRVRVYRNLHKPGVVYSVLQDGLVVGYVDEITLHGVKFVVNPAGRDWVRRTGKKTVHAFVDGYLEDRVEGLNLDEAIYYNPRKVNTFVYSNGCPIFSALWAYVGPNGVRV